MSKLGLGLLAAVAVAHASYGGTVFTDSFENPATGWVKFVQGGDIPSWAITDDADGEQSFLVNEARHNNAIDFHGAQALRLNEGGGIQRQVSLQAGQNYEFSLLGYSNYDRPLEIKIGSQTTTFSFGAYTAGMQLQLRTFKFTATQSGDVLLQILNPDATGGYRQHTIDNLALVTVPDGGASLVLLGLGLTTLALARRRLS